MHSAVAEDAQAGKNREQLVQAAARTETTQPRARNRALRDGNGQRRGRYRSRGRVHGCDKVRGRAGERWVGSGGCGERPATRQKRSGRLPQASMDRVGQRAGAGKKGEARKQASWGRVLSVSARGCDGERGSERVVRVVKVKVMCSEVGRAGAAQNMLSMGGRRLVER